MLGLLKEYHSRIRGEPRVVSYKLPNRFVFYRKILRNVQLIEISLILAWILGGLLSANWLMIMIVLASGIPISIFRFKFFKKLRKFFHEEWLIDFELLSIADDLNLLNDEFLYIIEKNTLKIVAYKNSPTTLNTMENLDKYLEAAFSMPLLNKEVEPGFVIYVLGEKEEISQITYKSIDEISTKTFAQPLDIIKLSSSVSFSLKSSSMLGLFGRTGSGKTVALQWYLLSAIAKGVGTDSNSLLTIIDGKEADLFSLAELTQQELAGNVSIGSTPNALAKLSREFVGAMNERFEIIKKQGKLNADAYDLGLTPSFLFIDELASIRDTCGNTKQGKELWQEIVTNIGLVSKKGRQGGFHLVLSTQDPNVENIPSEIRSQISSVLYLSQPSTERLRMAFSMCDLENVPDVPKQKGGGLFYADGLNLNEPIPIVAPFIDLKTKKDFVDVINKIKPDPNNFI